MTKVPCPVCHKDLDTRFMGNHLRQRHGVPVPQRKRGAAAWAAEWLKEQEPPTPTKKPKRRWDESQQKVVPATYALPDAADITAALVNGLLDHIEPQHVRPILRLSRAVETFLQEVR